MNNIYIKKEDLNEIVASYFNRDIISIEELLITIEDLYFEIQTLNEKIEEIEKDRDDNYTRCSVSSQVGISDRDFI